jgi:lycopene elongase/hydratase (dihydrobisanhydrobacterioruberin-forming)
MPEIRFLLKVSRPRFWIYVFGPYIVGLAASAGYTGQLWNWPVLTFGLYFLLPANLLIYGTNDIFDYETDKLNTKKSDYEVLVTPARWKTLGITITLLNLPFIAAAALFARTALFAMAAFVFLSIFYSALPIRAKAVPFIDSAFNFLYVLPGIFAYVMVTGVMPPVTLMIAGGLWTAAMHAFSAIPDIEADRQAGLSTIATTLGPRGTHVLCLATYIGSGLLSYNYLSYFGLTAATVYALLMIISLSTRSRDGAFRVYRVFPIVNALVGFALFLYIAFFKLLICFMLPCDPSPFH